jgi:hypothetical protein
MHVHQTFVTPYLETCVSVLSPVNESYHADTRNLAWLEVFDIMPLLNDLSGTTSVHE